MPDHDPVNSPKHYTAGSIECIEAIESALGPEGFQAYCRGQVIKYAWRAEHKGNPGQDLQKAKWYANRCSETMAAPDQPVEGPLCELASIDAILGNRMPFKTRTEKIRHLLDIAIDKVGPIR